MPTTGPRPRTINRGTVRDNDAYQYLGKFIVAEITTTIRAIPVEIKLGRREGLPSSCVANLDNIRTAARQWLDPGPAHWRHRGIAR
jgi:mRNA-degrading endonuclease toxin of MazEF toxin-antitoxin module